MLGCPVGLVGLEVGCPVGTLGFAVGFIVGTGALVGPVGLMLGIAVTAARHNISREKENGVRVRK